MKNATKAPKLLTEIATLRLLQPGAKYTPETGWTNDPVPVRVVMDGNRYVVTNDGLDRSYRLEAETVTFNDVPGTPVDDVERLCVCTGSKFTKPVLRWGTEAFESAIRTGEIVPYQPR